MAVIREGGTDPGNLRGRKGGTKGVSGCGQFRVLQIVLAVHFIFHLHMYTL